MIRGSFTPQPAVEALVTLPLLSETTSAVRFLLDTGAAFSVIHPRDAAALGIDAEKEAQHRPQVGGRGIGGRALYFIQDARLTFEHEDGGTATYAIPLHVALPTPANLDYPSFLGMDFLYAFELRMSMQRDLLTLDYVQA